MLDTNSIRADFPILQKNPNTIYFDNACMSLKPRQVLAAMEEYYTQYSGCHGRSAHRFSQKTTQKYEEAREKVARFIGAKAKEIVFTRNTTEGIALLAQQFLMIKQGRHGNERPLVTISDKEHNSNLVPWLRLKEKGLIDLKIIPTDKTNNTLSPKDLKKALQSHIQPPRLNAGLWEELISVGFVSNLDGVINPVEEIIEIAHQYNALVHLDAAQSAPHIPINVKGLDVDFLTFSGHKMLGPTGTGVFYAKKDLLEQMEPLVPGGGTVVGATVDSFEYLTAPEKFEGGLQNYAGAIGLAAAVDYLQEIDLENIHAHEVSLNTQLREAIESIDRVGFIGPTRPQSGITTFTVEGLGSRQVALLLDKTANIMVRSGRFCNHSWFAQKNLADALRVSLYLYNTEAEVERFVKILKQILKS